jgi:dihydrofolate reductase
MRILTYMVAVTADGFIAGEDGGLDFFPMTGEHLQYLAQEYPETFPQHLRASFAATGANRHFDTVVMGRRTYEVGSKLGLTNPYPQLRQFVLSRSMPSSADSAVQVVSADPIDLVRNLKQEQGLGIWLCGGAGLAGALYTELDEFVLKVNPVILGSGIPLIRGLGQARRLELTAHLTFSSGVAIHRYKVVPTATSA